MPCATDSRTRLGLRLGRARVLTRRAWRAPWKRWQHVVLSALPFRHRTKAAWLLRLLGMCDLSDEGRLALGLPGGHVLYHPKPAQANAGSSPNLADLWRLFGELWLSVSVLDEYDAAAFLHEDMTVVDVGAHIGTFSLLASKLVGPQGKVLALEPAPATFSCLLATVEANALRNVTSLQFALGGTRGALSLSVHPSLPQGHSAVLERSEQRMEVPMLTLDEVSAEQGLERLDFLKIDVEGYEPQVLQGAAEAIARFRPVIAVAGYHLPEHRHLLPEMLTTAENYDIRVASSAPGLDLICFAVPSERAAQRGG